MRLPPPVVARRLYRLLTLSHEGEREEWINAGSALIDYVGVVTEDGVESQSERIHFLRLKGGSDEEALGLLEKLESELMTLLEDVLATKVECQVDLGRLAEAGQSLKNAESLIPFQSQALDDARISLSFSTEDFE